MNALPPGISLRPFNSADLEFLFQVYADTRAEELAVIPWNDEQKAAFLRMQFNAQHSFYQTHYGDASFDLIIENEVPIGRLYVHRTPKAVNIVDIALLRSYQRRGIGRALMMALIAEADSEGKSVDIYVEENNRALQFYKQLGFVKTGEHGVYWSMSRSNETVAPCTKQHSDEVCHMEKSA